MKESILIEPYGGELVDLRVPDGEREEVRAHAHRLPSLQLSERALCDLELMAVGAFSPLDRFMGRETLQSVLDTMRLPDGYIFPMPITLPIYDDDIELKLDGEIALRDRKNALIGIMRIEEIYEWDRDEMAQKAFGTYDVRHPLIAEMHRWGPRNISGKLQIVELPRHYDFRNLRLTPAETREWLETFGKPDVIAFQTRNPLHRVHEELTKRAIQEVDGVLLLHPVVGMTKPGDVDHYTRVRTYQALTRQYYAPNRVLLALLPLAMRMAGPREALWHALIRRNYGANHLIIGRDHAGPGLNSEGEPFYGPYDAQELVKRHEDELGVKVVNFKRLVYMVDEDRYEEVSKIPEGTPTASISGTEVREEYLNNGKSLPDWFTRPEVAQILSETYPPRSKQGVCIWFTGLSGAGKSTTAEVLSVMLEEHGRQITVLDGDVVRTHLSKGLGFSKEDRDINIRRIGFVASEIVRHGGVVICAAVSPYAATRNDVRNMIGADHFVEAYVNTPLEVCEARDTKGLYEKARRGEITNFTGIDDPYEQPQHAEIVLDTVNQTVEENARRIIDYLIGRGFVCPVMSTAAKETIEIMAETD